MKQIPGVIAIAGGKPEIDLRTLLYSLIVVVPFSVFAIRQFGLVGAPLGLLILDLVYYFYAIPRYCKLCLRLPPIEWYARAAKYIGLIVFAYRPSLYVVVVIGEFDSIFLALGYIASTLLFLLGSFFVVGNEFKASVVEIVRLSKLKLVGAR